MNARGRMLLVASLVVLGVGVMLIGGAARSAADTISGCSTGKPICVSVSGDPDPASRSPVPGADHYMVYSFVVSYNDTSGATSKLTNLAVTATWADLGVTTTTSTYVATASDSRCTETSTRTLTCSGTPKSLTPGGSFSYGPLVFRTSTTTPDNPNDAEATGTNVSVTAFAQETPSPPKGGTNVSFVTTDNPTSYEGIGDQDISIAGQGLTTTLVTTNAGAVNQLAKLPVSSSAPRGLFTLEEADYAGSITCPAGLVCFGQHVSTVTVTGTSPVNLQIVFEGDRPGNETDLGVFHLRNGDTTPVLIDDMCPSATPTLAEIIASNGCLSQRTMTTIPGSGGDVHIELSAWDVTNGGWGGIS